MSKSEFLSELKAYLRDKLPADQVSRHADYYSNYIDDEMSKGRSEAEVLAELGDPRIVGKSLVDSTRFYQNQTDGQRPAGQTVSQTGSDSGNFWHIIKVIAVVIMVLAVVVVLFRFAAGLMVYIVPALIVVGIIAFIFRKRK